MARQSSADIAEIKELAENSFIAFAHLVNPHRLYGDVHKEVMNWWDSSNIKANSLLLLPRDHQKSHLAAVKAAWLITKDPSTTLLYVSATSGLAEKQLLAIKNILTHPIYRKYWPNMVNREEGKRELWNVTSLSVDHPIRAKEGIRDPTVLAAGLTTNITGFHANHVFLDDLVVPRNAYTAEGRETVRRLYSQLASIESTGATETVVGTRYHPNDLYSDLMNMKETLFDEDLNPVGEEKVYDVMERVVETNGEFLWPKESRSDGKVFGFDMAELARKKAKYLDQDQFYCQYYQQPNTSENQRLDRSRFQYLNPEFLISEKGVWKYKRKRLRLFAAADLAFTVTSSADYTAIVVIGVDEDGYIYVLDATRFKTDKYDQYYDKVMQLHDKWRFKKMLIETNAGGSLVAGYLKDEIRKEGGSLIIDQKASTKQQGSKEERIAAILEPRYENMSVYHFKGGMINILEEELIMVKPRNDDMKDALAAAVSISRPPAKTDKYGDEDNKILTHPRFGGVIGVNY